MVLLAPSYFRATRGTVASSTVIQALAGLEYTVNSNSERGKNQLDKTVYDFEVDTFICQNGMFGRGVYSDEDYKVIAQTGMKVWIFDGEQDTNNIDTYTKYVEAAKAIGYDDEWIRENIRLTAYPSELYSYWGESDHSTTRINGWYFDDAAYYGPDLQIVDGQIVYNTKLNDGDTYTLKSARCEQRWRNGKDWTRVHRVRRTVSGVGSGQERRLRHCRSSAADQITSIQATAVANFYGYKVGTVDITYAAGTDLTGVTADSYTLYDRGFNNPEFGEVEITGASVDGNVVTLTVDQGTDKVTDRSRETYGTLCTSSSWYVDSEGNVHYGDTQTTDALGITIYPNTIKKGLQWRENMDLVLCVNSDDITTGIRSTDGAGTMLADTVWEPTILADDLDKVELEMVDVGWKAADYTMLGDQGEVPRPCYLPRQL